MSEQKASEIRPPVAGSSSVKFGHDLESWQREFVLWKGNDQGPEVRTDHNVGADVVIDVLRMSCAVLSTRHRIPQPNESAMRVRVCKFELGAHGSCKTSLPLRPHCDVCIYSFRPRTGG